MILMCSAKSTKTDNVVEDAYSSDDDVDEMENKVTDASEV